MTKLKHAVFGIGLAVISGAIAIPSYAYYREPLQNAANVFSLSPVGVLHFAGNGGSGNMANVSLPFGHGHTVPENTLVKPNWLFRAWNTKADGSGVSIPEKGCIDVLPWDKTDTILYAQWEDETDTVLEPNWKENYDADKDGNGVPDRKELKPGMAFPKDPSVKNHTGKKVYAYMMLSIPTVEGMLSIDESSVVYDVATFVKNTHWKLVKAAISKDSSRKSQYLYRYEQVLEPAGSTVRNPYHSIRHADRTTDLISSVKMKDFISAGKVDASVDVTSLLIEATATIAQADKMAVESYITAGFLR